MTGHILISLSIYSKQQCEHLTTTVCYLCGEELRSIFHCRMPAGHLSHRGSEGLTFMLSRHPVCRHHPPPPPDTHTPPSPNSLPHLENQGTETVKSMIHKNALCVKISPPCSLYDVHRALCQCCFWFFFVNVKTACVTHEEKPHRCFSLQF